jgi:succinate dehydrogenase / fumarate reductase cytochrome b subunit
VLQILQELLLFGFHIFNGIKLWWENRQANPEKYAVDASKENSTFYSRTMPYTGGIILIFLLIHLATLWVKFNFGMDGTHHYYDVVATTFQSLPVAIAYVIVMLVLGFHLNHGFQSAFQTFGWHHKKYTPLVEFIGTAYAVIFAVGFAAIPIYFFILSRGGN